MSSTPTEFNLVLPIFTGGTSRVKKDGSLTKATKRYWLTMNNYRNWHHHTQNKTKKDFKTAVSPQIAGLPDLSALWGRVSLHYTFFPKTHAVADIMNAVSLVDKYFADALVENGKLKDDNYKICSGGSWDFGEVDKHNPRMEVTIRPYIKDPSAMKATTFTPRKVTPQNEGLLPSNHDQSKRTSYVLIELKEDELAEAVRNYIRMQMPIQTEDELPVAFIAGRGDNGHSAQITVQAGNITVVSPEQPTDAAVSFTAAAEAANEANTASDSSDMPEKAEDAAPEASEEEQEDTVEVPETNDDADETAEDVKEPGGEEDPVEDMVPAKKQLFQKPAPVVEDDETEDDEDKSEPEVVEKADPEPEPESDELSEVKDKRDAPKETRKASTLFGGAPVTKAKKGGAKPVNIFERL